MLAYMHGLVWKVLRVVEGSTRLIQEAPRSTSGNRNLVLCPAAAVKGVVDSCCLTRCWRDMTDDPRCWMPLLSLLHTCADEDKILPSADLL